ncbi:hypothetical protein P3T76_015150 [Phytophthora citrophthora]|uniref:Uncharacterized protein n=1 Tax=Phytophthora citrophthora TaxID=4793 RepID=A0AAD9G0J1_9STRA|nr:hypothetical protein P3T76_015150 [Phytophthora citrophthora]
MASRSVAAPAAALVAAQLAVPTAPTGSLEVLPHDPSLSGSPAAGSSLLLSGAHAGSPVELNSDEEALWEALVLAGRPALEAMASSPGSVAMSESSDSVAIPAPPISLQERIFELPVEGSEYDSDKAFEGAHDDDEEAHDAWFFDSDDDEERPRLSSLRRGDETAVWHPPLPPAPTLHPWNGRDNFYEPEAEWDYSKPCEVVRLLDVAERFRIVAISWSGNVRRSNSRGNGWKSWTRLGFAT